MRKKPATNPGKVLIIDDDAAIRFLLVSILEKEGYTTLEASNGNEGILLLKKEDIRLVLLDYMMPGMDGIDVLQVIRLLYNTFELPVIMVTTRDETESILKALSAGANDYITKPVNPKITVARINTHYELNEMRKKYLESRQRLEMLNDISLEGIVIHDRGNIIDANNAFLNMFEMTLEEARKQNLSSFLLPGDNAEITDFFNKNTEKYFEGRGLKKDGSIINLELLNREMVYEKNKLNVIALRDISEKVHYEQLLSNLFEKSLKFNEISSLLPVCAWCKKICDENGYWQKIEQYFQETYKKEVAHSICPDCSVLLEEQEQKEIEIDKESLSVRVQGEKVYFTLMEFKIISYLYENYYRIVSIDELLEKVMGYPTGLGNPDSIRTHITRIRGKIEKAGKKSEIIVNFPKAGYQFVIK